MADEKKAKEGAKQESKAENKVIAWIKALPKRIATPFKNMVNELKRVTWPSKQKLIRYSIIVLVFVLVMMLIIGLFDFGSARLVNALHISKTEEAATAATTADDTAAAEEVEAEEETPAEETPSEENPAEEPSEEEVPTEEPSSEETPAEETPVEENPVEEAPVDTGAPITEGNE